MVRAGTGRVEYGKGWYREDWIWLGLVEGR